MPRPKKLIEAVIQDDENTALEVAKSEVQVSDFELVTDIVVGKLTSNAKEFSAVLEKELQNYTVERYLDDPDAADKDKKYLNKLLENVAEKRKMAVKTWNKPLEEFISVMTELENNINSASNSLKTIVDKAKQQEKDKKKEKIVEFWNTLNFTIIPLERVFNPKWLNKGEKMTSIMEECQAIVDKINGEMETLKSMQDEDSNTLQAFYLETLDLNATLQKGNQLKENRARIKAEEERKAAEMAKLCSRDESHTAAEIEGHVDIGRKSDVSTVSDPIVRGNNPNVIALDECAFKEQKEPVATFRLEVTASASKLMALRKFIDANGITYKKI